MTATIHRQQAALPPPASLTDDAGDAPTPEAERARRYRQRKREREKNGVTDVTHERDGRDARAPSLAFNADEDELAMTG